MTAANGRAARLVLAALVAIGCGVPPAVSRAQDAGAPVRSRQRADRPVVTGTRVTEPPLINGRLDDAVWRTAARITEFVQQRPVEGAPASERTEVYVAYDSQKLYFGIYAHYSDLSLMRANRVDRDATQNDDTVAISFDPFLDQQRGYSFSVNGYGVQADALLGGSASTPDTSWNVLYESAGVIVEDGWTAEIAVPIRSLRYPGRGPGEQHRWGFQIQREIRGKDETVTWAPLSTDIMGALAQMGVLDGLRDLSTRRNLEILPTFTAVQTGALDAAGRLADDNLAESGINVKYGITPNVTLDATYNPDFSQIESDRPQIEINQRFPLFFAELRPFFLEGQEIFKILGPFYFLHTRTILDPKYGLKLSGKSGRTTFAILAANDESPGRVGDATAPEAGKAAHVLSGRVKYDLGGENTLGVLVVDREFVDRHTRLGVVDGSYRISRNYRIQTTAAYSDHRDQAGVLRTGQAFDVGMLKQGRNFGYVVAENMVSPEFRNDAGFVSRVDFRKTITSVNYRWWPETWVVNWGPRLGYDRTIDYRGILQDSVATVNMQGTFAKSVTFSASAIRSMERYLERDFSKGRISVFGAVNTNRRMLVRADMSYGDEIRFVADPYLGRTATFNATVTMRPWSRFQSEATINATRFTDVRSGRVDFDVKIFRALTTYQFTKRLLIRNILEANTLNKTVGVNLLGTYRVNAGTVFFVGYDDRYREGDRIDPLVFPTAAYQRTNRALFAKVQYLYRN